MKRLLPFVLFAVVVLASGNAFAQLAINKGIKAGLNVANVRIENDEGLDLGSRNGLAGGVYFEIDPLGPLAFQIEALYSQKGASSTVEILGQSFDTKIKVDYIEIPVLLKFGLTLPPPAKPSFFVGPALGFNIKAESEVENETEDLKDSVKSTDFGVVFGAALGLTTGFGEVVIDVRYNLGLSDVNADADTDGTIKNSALTASLGIGF